MSHADPITLAICRRCDEDDELYSRVKKLRKKLGYKEIFHLESVRCVRVCESPCNIEYSGDKRSTYTRTEVHQKRDVEAVVQAAVDYAKLSKGEELPERKLPGTAAF
jgi:predicted metal-binding protein